MTDELLDAIEADSHEPVDLTEIRKRAVALRDNYLQKAELEHKLKMVSHAITKIERDELPDLFTRAKISSLTVEASGNHPAFVAQRKTVFSALIPEEKRLEAFQWLEQNGYGDLVKSNINIVFGMGQHDEKLKVMAILDLNGIQYYTNESVHHMTLKAQVKRWLQDGTIIPMDLLGVYIFDEVKIK